MAKKKISDSDILMIWGNWEHERVKSRTERENTVSVGLNRKTSWSQHEEF